MPAATSISDALGQFLQQQSGGVGSVATPTNTLIFSSTLRDQRALGGVTSVLDTDVPAFFGAFAVSPEQLRSGLGPVRLMINPHTITPTQGKRMARQDTLRGVVYQQFADALGQNNDILTLTFAGSTGCINPDICVLPEAKEKATQRLLTWHSLYQLTRERVLLPDGTPNEFTIVYESQLFPVPLVFHGQYASVMKWPQDRMKPNSIEYSFEFIVQDTTPDMNDMYEHIVNATNLIATE